MAKYTKLDLAKQLKKDSTLYTWANAKPKDAGIHALLVRKGYLYSKEYEKQNPNCCDIVTEQGYKLIKECNL
jgi:hypothetical protein